MSSPISAVNIRRLPDGREFHGMERGWKGRLLTIEVSDPLFKDELGPGALVECTTQNHAYLGVIQETAAEEIFIAVEHSIERARLEPINDIWR